MPNLIEDKSPVIFDNIFIVGPDLDYDSIVETLKSLEQMGRKIAIIKTADDYEMIRGRIGSQTRIDVYAHGSLGINESKQSTHFIEIPLIPFLPQLLHHQDQKTYTRMMHFTAYIKDLAGKKDFNGLQVHLWSCYGGLAVDAAEFLPVGATLILHAPSNAPVPCNLVHKYLKSGLERHCSEPRKEFMHILAESPNEATFAQKIADSVLVHRSPLTNEILMSNDETQSHITTKITHYHQTLYNSISVAIPDFLGNETSLLEEQLKQYATEVAYLHAEFDENSHYIQDYIAKKGMHPREFSYDGIFLPHIAAHRMNIHLSTFWDYILEHHIDINMPTQSTQHDVMSPIQALAFENNLDGVNFLLSLGADVNCIGKEGRTALMDASHLGHLALVKRLLQEKNILVNAKRDIGYTALILAAEQGHLAVVEELLQAGADPTLRSLENCTALTRAAANGHALVVERLLQNKLNFEAINQTDEYGTTALFAAVNNGYADIVALLAQWGADLNLRHKDGQSLIYLAAEMGHVSVIKELVKIGVNLNEQMNYGFTPIFIAAMNGHAKAVAELIIHGADPTIPNQYGTTPALIASRYGHAHVLAELAKHSVDLNAPNQYGNTPAMVAAEYGQVNVIIELAKHPVDFNALNKEGCTAAYIAATNGQTAVITELFRHHADFNQPCFDGTTPLIAASWDGRVEAVKQILAHKQVKNTAVLYSAQLLRSYVSDKAADIQTRMEALIQTKLAIGQDEQAIAMLACEAAHVMGHDEVANLLSQALKDSIQAETDSWGRECKLLPNENLTVMQVADNFNHLFAFDFGAWDSTIHTHPTTGEPIFIYHVYKNGVEVGSASFYKHPLLCRSEAGDRHNIITTTGLFSTLDIDTRSCQALPPTLLDRVVTSAKQGAQHGAVRGVAHLIGYTLKSRCVPPSIAQAIEQTLCYGGYFLLHFNAYAAQEKTLDWSGALNAAAKASLDTGSMFIVSHVMQRLSQSINRLGEQVQQSGFIKTSNALRFFSTAAQYGVYAYDAVQRGIVDAAASVVAGGVTQYAIEHVGERVVGRGY